VARVPKDIEPSELVEQVMKAHKLAERYLKYLYHNPQTGRWTGFWACPRPTGKYTGLWPPSLIERIFAFCGKPNMILEPFGGRSKLGVSVDINRDVRPTVVADAQHLPFREKTFDMVLADPPYEDEFVEHYAGLAKRRIKFTFYKALVECARVCKHFLIILHFLIPTRPKAFDRIATIGVSSGPNKRIRCLSIFRRKRGGVIDELQPVKQSKLGEFIKRKI